MDAFARAERNAFVIHTVNRAHNRRRDEPWLERTLVDPATRFVLVWRDKILVSNSDAARLVKLAPNEVSELQATCNEVRTDVVLLGELADTLYFAVGVDAACERVPDIVQPHGQMVDLRSLATDLTHEEGALAAQAKAMVHWHRQHRYCGRCGSETRTEEGGYLLRCQNTDCGETHFPRVDPAIIVLVTSGDHCLLGRQPHWPEGRYSNIAGFVEPGESLETAVAREVWEETGVRVKAVHYHSSQPWPFPQSLMVGFTAEAATRAINLNDGELEDARWFTRALIREGLEAGDFGLPSTYSISFHLIEDWYDRGDCGSLRDLLGDRPNW
jgi:NAD+ diphosphatase